MLVESTLAGHKMAKDAKKHIQEYKQKIGNIECFISVSGSWIFVLESFASPVLH